MVVNEEPNSSPKTEECEDPEEEDVLKAVAKHFGKDMEELTLEALLKLEQRKPGQEEQNDQELEGDIPKRKAPSLESILGPMPTAATLGLPESISSCIKDGKENGECSLVFCILFHPSTGGRSTQILLRKVSAS